MTPDIKPTIIPASRFLSDTIAAMIAAGQYCQATLPGGAVMRYKPDSYWAIYRQGERPQSVDAKLPVSASATARSQKPNCECMTINQTTSAACSSLAEASDFASLVGSPPLMPGASANEKT